MVVGAEEKRTIRRILIGAVAPSGCAERLGTSSLKAWRCMGLQLRA